MVPAPENRPDNAVPNSVVPPANWLTSYDQAVANGEGGAPGSWLQRADGQYTGTTDEILQWGSCKWGFDANVTRATAVNESHWHQDAIGDNGESYGILQIKITAGNYPSTVPYEQNSTAFNVDYKLAQQRACFEGQISYLTGRPPLSGYPTYQQAQGNVDQMLWGCVGQWFSGGWYDSGAVNYINEVQSYLASKPWLQPGF